VNYLRDGALIVRVPERPAEGKAWGCRNYIGGSLTYGNYIGCRLMQ
jgi:hypothetical protein